MRLGHSLPITGWLPLSPHAVARASVTIPFENSNRQAIRYSGMFDLVAFSGDVPRNSRLYVTLLHGEVVTADQLSGCTMCEMSRPQAS